MYSLSRCSHLPPLFKTATVFALPFAARLLSSVLRAPTASVVLLPSFPSLPCFHSTVSMSSPRACHVNGSRLLLCASHARGRCLSSPLHSVPRDCFCLLRSLQVRHANTFLNNPFLLISRSILSNTRSRAHNCACMRKRAAAELEAEGIGGSMADVRQVAERVSV